MSPGSREALKRALRDAVHRSREGASEVSLLFSGGLDSALLAQLLRPDGPPGGALELLTVGTEGAHDLEQGARAAGILHLPWSGHGLVPDDVVAARDRVVQVLSSAGELPPTGVMLEVQTGTFLALERTTHARVLCGQGADELFLGYAHFVPLSGEALERRYREDLRRLQEQDRRLSERLATALGKELRFPYLDPGLVRALENVPLEARRPDRTPKGLLRDLAKSLGLPRDLADRPKKAFQYGAGLHRVLAPR